jgi:hypothetical protein
MDINDVASFCEKEKYRFGAFGKNARLFLFGEDHGNESHFNNQVKMINELRPSVVLHEFYDVDARCPFPDIDKWEQNSFWYKMNAFSRLSRELGFDLLPADASVREREYLSDGLGRTLENGELKWPKELRGRRLGDANIAYAQYYSRLIVEPIMGMRLRRVLDDYDGIVVGVYGDYHLRGDSQLHSVLRLDFPPLSGSDFFSSANLEKVDYVAIRQGSKNQLVL